MKENIVKKIKIENIYKHTLALQGVRHPVSNLKFLNESVNHQHFKMDTIRDVLLIVKQNCYFTIFDSKLAYFSVNAHPSSKWLRFIWNGKRYQFTCLASAPRRFVKLMTPVFSHLRKLGMTVLGYIDDCIFISHCEHTLLQ